MLNRFGLGFLISIVVCFSFQSNSTWSDSVCDKSTTTFQGATRDFYNRGAFLKWQHKLGDWYDSQEVPQGVSPFSTLKSNSTSEKLTADVTELVKKWHVKKLTAHGFFLTYAGGAKVAVYSREYENNNKQPKLYIETDNSTYLLVPSRDTELKLGTYSCIGQNPVMNVVNPVLLDFNINAIVGDIKHAELHLYVVRPNKKETLLSVFAINIQTTQTQNRGTVEPTNPTAIFYRTSFETDNWDKRWQTNFKGQYEVKSTTDNEFEPLEQNALAITIAKGTNTGIGATLALDQFQEFINSGKRSAYVQYYLRFGNDWFPNSDGKLPGFSGTYVTHSYQGGWGGRKTNGQNGWSARGRFTAAILYPNPYTNYTAIGSYIYHADQKSQFGDHFFWDISNDYVLKKNHWYRIEQYIKLNEIGKSNGELKAWIDGKLVFSKSNFKFSDNPLVNLEQVWLNVYHGGKLKAHADMTLYIDNLTVSTEYIGPTN